jgi:unsaturated rhamnogalacturonyl hydrolase
MPAPSHRPRLVACLAAASLALTSTLGAAEGSYRNRDNPNPKDSGDPTYPIPYYLPTEAELREVLQRVHGFVDRVSPTQVVDRKTGKPITDLSKPVKEAATTTGEGQFNPLAYEMGVIHSGMLAAAKVTGDKRYTDFTRRHTEFIAKHVPYFRAQEEQFHLGRGNSFRGIIAPVALDDTGSMCAAIIRARLDNVGPDLMPVIERWSRWISKEQYRLPDGTLARQRPQTQSLWADDFYMSVPALAEMGRLTGDRAWFDDAVKNVLQMSKYLFVPEKGIYTHGWNVNNPNAPHFFWARANGWAVLAISDLLDVLPKDHPDYAKVMEQHVALLRGISQYQSGKGLWHQMMDRPDSYLESSATAMFVYGLAHAINQGWISPTNYGSIAQAGWNGLLTRITPEGAIEGICVGTTYASDQVYYYHRPTSIHAMHGYGPVLLAGAEMIKLLKNPEFEIQMKLRTYHYVPKNAGPLNYSEHP